MIDGYYARVKNIEAGLSDYLFGFKKMLLFFCEAGIMPSDLARGA